jgi:GxxExxY protein
MNTDERAGKMDRELDGLTHRIIGCAYTVSNRLGVGFLEKVYENALAFELRKAGLKVEQQRSTQVKYENVIVGDYTADLLVEDVVLVELKVAKAFDEIHFA